MNVCDTRYLCLSLFRKLLLPALGIKKCASVERTSFFTVSINLSYCLWLQSTHIYSTYSTDTASVPFLTKRMPSAYEILGLSENCTQEEARERFLELSQEGQVVETRIMEAYIHIKDFAPSYEESTPQKAEGWSLVATKKKTPSRPLTKNAVKQRRPSLGDEIGDSLNNDAEGERFGEDHLEENVFKTGWWEGDIVQKQKATKSAIKSKAKKTKTKTVQSVANYGNPGTPGPSSWS